MSQSCEDRRKHGERASANPVENKCDVRSRNVDKQVIDDVKDLRDGPCVHLRMDRRPEPK